MRIFVNESIFWVTSSKDLKSFFNFSLISSSTSLFLAITNAANRIQTNRKIVKNLILKKIKCCLTSKRQAKHHENMLLHYFSRRPLDLNQISELIIFLWFSLNLLTNFINIFFFYLSNLPKFCMISLFSSIPTSAFNSLKPK